MLWGFAPPLVLNLFALGQPWWNPRLIYVDPLVAPQIAGFCCGRYFGAYSNIGVLFWVLAAACCALAAMQLRAPADAAMRRCLTLGALLSGVLGLDDLFMLHEDVLPHIGVSETTTFAAYGILAGVYLWQNWRIVRAGEPLLFGLAAAFLVASVGIDVFNLADDVMLPLAEDAAKLMGVAGWGVYHMRLASRALAHRTHAVAAVLPKGAGVEPARLPAT